MAHGPLVLILFLIEIPISKQWRPWLGVWSGSALCLCPKHGTLGIYGLTRRLALTVNWSVAFAGPFYSLDFCMAIQVLAHHHQWATTRQNQQNDCAPSDDSDQPGHPPSLIRVFAVRMKKPWVLSYPLSASEDTDQTGRVPRLIWVFAGRTVTLLVLSYAAHYSLFQTIRLEQNFLNPITPLYEQKDADQPAQLCSPISVCIILYLHSAILIVSSSVILRFLLFL